MEVNREMNIRLHAVADKGATRVSDYWRRHWNSAEQRRYNSLHHSIGAAQLRLSLHED